MAWMCLSPDFSGPGRLFAWFGPPIDLEAKPSQLEQFAHARRDVGQDQVAIDMAGQQRQTRHPVHGPEVGGTRALER